MAVFTSILLMLLAKPSAGSGHLSDEQLAGHGPQRWRRFLSRRFNVFRKGDDFIIIAELPGVKKSDLDVQVKGRTVRLAGERTVGYPEVMAALHRRERLAGRFDRASDNAHRDQPGRRAQGPNIATASWLCSCRAPRATSRSRSRWHEMTAQPKAQEA